MNTYSLTSDSRRWWWPSATAGSAASALIVATLVLPTAVQAVPEPVAPAEPAYSVPVPAGADHPCFLVRAHWNVGLDGFQPRCAGTVAPPVREVVLRPGLAYVP